VPNLPDGTFDLDIMQNHIRTRDLHEPRTALICVENTHNKCGGKVVPLAWLDEVHYPIESRITFGLNISHS
jgi:threonine aldolase